MCTSPELCAADPLHYRALLKSITTSFVSPMFREPLQVLYLLSLQCFIVVVEEANSSCVISEIDDVVGALSWVNRVNSGGHPKGPPVSRIVASADCGLSVRKSWSQLQTEVQETELPSELL